jgi:hypothetical protein
MKRPGLLVPREQEELTIVPLTLKMANAYVTAHHRHHKAAVGHKFSLGVVTPAGELVGVVIVGRPVARHLDDGWTAEVNRLCVRDCPNACSALYAAARRTAFAMGYYRILTYILVSEPGTSLKAAGWVNKGEAGGGSWFAPSRPRGDHHPLERKQRWEVTRGTPPPYPSLISDASDEKTPPVPSVQLALSPPKETLDEYAPQ